LKVKAKTFGASADFDNLLDSDALKKVLTREDLNSYYSQIQVHEISPSKFQPRKTFNDSDLQALANSIKKQGVLQPIILRKATAENNFELLAGERRWRAAQLCGLMKVPAIIVEATDKDAAMIAIVENVQRENLNPIDEAMGFKKIISDYGYTQEDFADTVGRSRSSVANQIRLLKLEGTVQELIKDRSLEVGHGKVLLACSGEDQIDLAMLAAKKKMSVRALESKVKNCNSKHKHNCKTTILAKSKDAEQLESILLETTGTKVQISCSTNSKAIKQINFSDPTLMRHLLELLAQ